MSSARSRTSPSMRARLNPSRLSSRSIVSYSPSRPHRGAGVSAGRLLIDGDSRRQPLNEVHVGLLHLAEELAGVGGEALHVAALAFGIDGVEGKAPLPRPGETGG